MRKFLSILLWAYWTICFFLCLFIITILFIITWPVDPLKEIPNRVLKLLAWLILIPIPSWRVNIKGAGLNKIVQPTLVVANHQSFLDLPLLYLLPWNMKWVTKRSMLRIPVLGWMIRMTGHIPIDRQSLRSIQAMDALIKPIEKGIPGMIFPEGTRTVDGSVQSFKRGAFMIAKKYNFQVLPVVLKGGHRAMPAGSWSFRFGNHFNISVLEPVNPEAFENAHVLKNHVEQLIKNELEQL